MWPSGSQSSAKGSSGDIVTGSAGRRLDGVNVLACVERPRLSAAGAKGWKAYRVDDPLDEETLALAFYWPDCAPREFGA